MSKTPIKRNKSLVVLSKEHHFGLLACWKIRQGIALNIEPERMRNYINYFWENHLVQHFATEENILFKSSEGKLINTALSEHDELRSQIKLINDGVTIANLNSFANLLEHHIRFEERELFQLLQAELSEEKLNKIGEEIEELGEEPFVENYEDTFWIKPK